MRTTADHVRHLGVGAASLRNDDAPYSRHPWLATLLLCEMLLLLWAIPGVGDLRGQAVENLRDCPLHPGEKPVI